MHTHFYIIMPSFRTFWTLVRYPDDEMLKEAVKEWSEGQTEDFSGTSYSVGIMLKNKV